MKTTATLQQLEAILRSSALVADGFMGNDTRSVQEIIDADRAELERLGVSSEQIAERMGQMTQAAIPQLGNWVAIGTDCQGRVQEARGRLVCPWPHPGRFAKRVTTVQRMGDDQVVWCLTWSDLNIHLIREHGFFEGRGSTFRNDPEALKRMLF